MDYSDGSTQSHGDLLQHSEGRVGTTSISTTTTNIKGGELNYLVSVGGEGVSIRSVGL